MTLRIALACGNFAPQVLGGSMVSADMLARELGKRWNVDIVCGSAGDAVKRGAAHLPYRVVELHPFPYLSFSPERTNLKQRASAANALRQYFDVCSEYCKNSVYDIVDAQGPWCETASIVTIRFVYAEYLRILGDAGIQDHSNDPWSKTILELESRAYRSASVNAYIAVSDKAKKELQHHYAIPSKKIRVIRNGVDASRFSSKTILDYRAQTRASLGVSNEDAVVAYCGNNSVRKNLRAFLDVVRPLYKAGLKTALLASADKCKHLLTTEDLQHSVYFAVTPWPERILAASDVLLFPTLYDTCAKIVLEAMALGIPTIVSQHSGVCDLITNGVNGYCIDVPVDVDLCREYLQHLIESAALRQSMGEKAAHVIRGRLTWDAIADEFASVYTSISPISSPGQP